MTMKTLVSLILVSISSTLALSPRVLTSDFVDEINSKQSTWVAGRNFPENVSLEDLHRIGSGGKGLHPDPNFKLKIQHHEARAVLPTSFDAREAWPFCQSISDIRSQGACGSCWVFGSVTAMTDRLCIHSNGREKFKFSAEEPLSCCNYCGNCVGGYPGGVYQYWTEEGVVSGGDAGSNEGCEPYSFDAESFAETPECVKSCVSGYRVSFQQDKHYGLDNAYGLDGEEGMAREILANGPITVMYELFEDFYSYRSGIYQHVTGDSVGYHVVKVFGWGQENGIPYWLVANSWGTGFGENGFFRIIKGRNECYIESMAIAGMPRIL